MSAIEEAGAFAASADEEAPPPPERQQALIFPRGNDNFAAGLFWQLLNSPKFNRTEVVQLAKSLDFNAYAFCTGGTFGEATQAGYCNLDVGSPELAGTYSLAAVLMHAVQLTGLRTGDTSGSVNSWIGVFELGEDRWYFIAVLDGLLLPDGDLIGDQSAVLAKLQETMEGGHWDAFVGSQAIKDIALASYVEKSLEDFFTVFDAQRKAFKDHIIVPAKTFEFKLPKGAVKIAVGLSLLAGCGYGGWYFYDEYQLQQERLAAQAAAKAAAKEAAAAAAKAAAKAAAAVAAAKAVAEAAAKFAAQAEAEAVAAAEAEAAVEAETAAKTAAQSAAMDAAQAAGKAMADAETAKAAAAKAASFGGEAEGIASEAAAAAAKAAMDAAAAKVAADAAAAAATAAAEKSAAAREQRRLERIARKNLDLISELQSIAGFSLQRIPISWPKPLQFLSDCRKPFQLFLRGNWQISDYECAGTENGEGLEAKLKYVGGGPNYDYLKQHYPNILIAPDGKWVALQRDVELRAPADREGLPRKLDLMPKLLAAFDAVGLKLSLNAEPDYRIPLSDAIRYANPDVSESTLSDLDDLRDSIEEQSRRNSSSGADAANRPASLTPVSGAATVAPSRRKNTFPVTPELMQIYSELSTQLIVPIQSFSVETTDPSLRLAARALSRPGIRIEKLVYRAGGGGGGGDTASGSWRLTGRVFLAPDPKPDAKDEED